MKSTVGRSLRTPLKHWLLNSELGRLVGVLSLGRSHAKACPFHVIDLCAGDGQPTAESEDTSPAIIEHHGRSLLSRLGEMRATFIERDKSTFAELQQNVSRLMWIECLNQDATTFTLNPVDKHQAIFIHADPNNVNDWPISGSLLESMTETTTLLATMGCNVSGLKRLPLESRERWFTDVDSCINRMPRYHDALLIELVNDSHQWAYLLRLPEKWSCETAAKLLTSGIRHTPFDLHIESYRQSRNGFLALQRKLFLTKKERGEK